MKIVLATHNPGKIREFSTYFANLPIEWVSAGDLNVPDIEETGLSFIENALIKARHASKHTQLPAIADDSGLCVEALFGQPGIYSARYAGEQATSNDNIQKLLQAMQDVPRDKRQANFHCTLAFVMHALDPQPIIAEGSWSGEILTTRVGTQGFGYDPVFYAPELACSAAECSLEQKQRVSHRGQALSHLKQRLSAYL